PVLFVERGQLLRRRARPVPGLIGEMRAQLRVFELTAGARIDRVVHQPQLLHGSAPELFALDPAVVIQRARATARARGIIVPGLASRRRKARSRSTTPAGGSARRESGAWCRTSPG